MVYMQILAVAAICVVTCQANEERKSGGLQGSNLAKQIQDIYTICKDKKAVCVGMPQNCISTNSCVYMASIEQSTDNKHTFKMVDTAATQGYYVAVGISEDGKNMKDTSLVACSSSNMDVFWAVGATSPSKVTNKPYFQNKEHSASNGKIYCVFDLDSSFDEHGVKFDLQKKNYAVLLARADGISPGYHDENKKRFGPMRLSSSSGSFSSPMLLVTATLSLMIARIIH
ncbi:putative ferric-chelate reductase 1 [Folsomia candida]|uniref:Putative ferric-chelate reductase 1 n=1 Tax=Folsomia candida TaxID=158441 RepID=A0A226EIM6_FOLCA|nr:putative ferric-chelate reductase 1 [Folsomia candida]